RADHRAHVEVHCEIEFRVLHVEYAAGVHEAGAVGENVHLADLSDACLHSLVGKHVELAGGDVGLGGEFVQLFEIDVGRVNLCAALGKSQRGRAADSLRGGGDKNGFSG